MTTTPKKPGRPKGTQRLTLVGRVLPATRRYIAAEAKRRQVSLGVVIDGLLSSVLTEK